LVGVISNKSLAVFVPALNEERHLAATIDVVLRALQRTCADYQIIIVNDGSTDNTGNIADGLASQNTRISVIHHESRQGLGRGYRAAVAAATKSAFVFIPGDNSWPLGSIVTLFSHLGDADVVTSYPTNVEVERSPSRRVLSSVYTKLLNFLHGLQLRYYNGLTIYPTEYLRDNPVKGSGFGFAAELLLGAIYRGMTVFEVGLAIQESAGGPSKAVTGRNIASVLRSILRGFWHYRILARQRQPLNQTRNNSE
jgi:glycosyltransferase involved in cell wall biosynthesis